MIRTTTVAKGTTVGSSTTKTQINTATKVTMPSWARNLESIEPYMAVDVLDADLTAFSKVTLESEDVALDPCIVLTNAISGYDATSGQPYQPENPVYKVNCPLKGGEEISVYGTNLQAFTGPIYIGCTITITDQPPTERQRFYQVGTVTETGTSAAEVSGTAYNIHGSDRIREVLGLVVPEIHAAENALFGSFRITSQDFVHSVPLEYGFQAMSGCIGTVDGTRIPGITRFEVDVPTHTSCTLQDYCTFDLAPTVHGFFISAVGFNKAGR